MSKLPPRHVEAQAVSDFALISLYLNNRCCVEGCGRWISIPLDVSRLPNVSERGDTVLPGQVAKEPYGLQRMRQTCIHVWRKWEDYRGERARLKQKWSSRFEPRTICLLGETEQPMVWSAVAGLEMWCRKDVVGIRTEKATNPSSSS